MLLRTCATCEDSDHLAHAPKFHSSFYYQFIHFVLSNDFVPRQWRPWSDCAGAQENLGLRCPCMPEDSFSQGTAQLSTVHDTNLHSESICFFHVCLLIKVSRLLPSSAFLINLAESRKTGLVAYANNRGLFSPQSGHGLWLPSGKKSRDVKYSIEIRWPI